MLSPTIKNGFTLLELMFSVAISSLIIVGAGHLITNQLGSLSQTQEKSSIRGIYQSIVNAIQSASIISTSAEYPENLALKNCYLEEGTCRANVETPFVLRSATGNIIYAGTEDLPRFYKSSNPKECRRKNIPPQECKIAASVSFIANCLPTARSQNPATCQRAADISVILKILPTYAPEKVYEGKSTISILSNQAVAIQSSEQCPDFSVKKTRRRNGESATECECKPGFQKEISNGVMSCKDNQMTGCGENETYRGFKLSGDSRDVQPDCKKVHCKNYTHSQFVRTSGGVVSKDSNEKTMGIKCPSWSWLNGVNIQDCRASTCFFKPISLGDRKCYRDPNTQVEGVPVKCTIRYRCCSNHPNPF
ncbi:MAG: PilW family protein [Oligoflexales bacterium]